MTDENFFDADPDILLTEYREAEEYERNAMEIIRAAFNHMCDVLVQEWTPQREQFTKRLRDWLKANQSLAPQGMYDTLFQEALQRHLDWCESNKK